MLVYLAALVVLLGAAYVIWNNAPRLEEPARGATSTPSVTEVRIEESTDVYTIEGEYPQFGVAAMDTAVKRIVEEAVAAFKAYPANPADSAVPKNEQSISYGSVYLGQDFLSTSLVISEYTGGAHPNSVITGVTVDRASGAELSLDGALALIGRSLEQLAADTDARLRSELADAYFPEGATAKPENYSVFIVSEDEVTFIFNNYQVGPYVIGPQFVAFERVK